MKIRYKKKRLTSNLIIGIVWAAFGLLTFSYDAEARWMDFGYIVMALLYLGQYAYESSKQYLTVTKHSIRKNRFFGNSLKLNKITRIKKFAGDYILQTDTEELIINTDWIAEKSLLELNRILSQLNLPADKTPFSQNN